MTEPGDIARAWTRTEYWIVCQVLEFRLQLGTLGQDDFAEHQNRSPAGCPRGEIARAAATLLGEGVIEIDGVDRDADAEERILDVLQHWKPGDPESYVYEITTRGGRVWEEFARPRWENFFDVGFFSGGGRVTAAGSHLLHIAASKPQPKRSRDESCLGRTRNRQGHYELGASPSRIFAPFKAS